MLALAWELVRDTLRLQEFYRPRVILDLKAEIEKGWYGETYTKTIQRR